MHREEVEIKHAILSDVGMRRANNQDSAIVHIAEPDRWQRRGHLFVVADGMGAHAAGELASKMAVEQIPHHYLRPTDAVASDALRKSIQEANAEIHQRGQQNPEFHNMGTTASSMAILAEGAVIGHVGDSRVYRLRNQILEQMTFDHSLVWEMEAAGQFKGDANLSSTIPKNVITRSLGPSREVMVDVEGPWQLAAGDKFLLCSDGLTGQVDDVEIGVLLDCLSPDKACRVLIDLANLRGGPDNITIIVVEIEEKDMQTAADSSAPNGPQKNKMPAISAPLAAAAIACILAAILFAALQIWPLAAGAALIGIIAGLLIVLGMNKSEAITEPETNSNRNTTSPYRRYRCSDNKDLLKKLAGTVHALREAAIDKKWKVNWTTVDKFESDSTEASAANKPRDAVRFQSEAIIATMEQLREQHRRQASDSTLDL